jgi:uncharacterized pyridoxamine 5'-phosphate oxidase family protein
VDSEGNPRNRLFTSVLEYQGQCVIATGAEKAVYAQLTKNPAVAITGINQTTATWIRIHGKARPLDDLKAKEECAEKNPMILDRFTGPEDPNLKLFSISGEAIIYRPGEQKGQILETKISLK